ncbi:MAG TPA: cyanophycinase [Planctomycetota bacterium]|nr:cyanophycinase [Planctomycetota bacterium]
MRFHRACCCLPFLLAACASTNVTAVRRPPPPEPGVTGHLMVVGGGGTTPAMTARMLELGGGTDANIVILPQASESPDRGQGSREMWTALGATHVVCLDPLTEAEGEKALAAATLIWFPGGDQSKLMKALEDARLVDDVARRHRQGALVGGTSAGAAVMSRLMLTGEADLVGVRAKTTELVPGLGLWHDAIVDQHFVKRQRWARLFSAVLDHPEYVGVGIDERTAVEVDSGSWRVWGDGSVVIFDARRAETVPPESGARQSARGVSVTLLRDGDVFSLR